MGIKTLTCSNPNSWLFQTCSFPLFSVNIPSPWLLGDRNLGVILDSCLPSLLHIRVILHGNMIVLILSTDLSPSVLPCPPCCQSRPIQATIAPHLQHCKSSWDFSILLLAPTVLIQPEYPFVIASDPTTCMLRTINGFLSPSKWNPDSPYSIQLYKHWP